LGPGAFEFGKAGERLPRRTTVLPAAARYRNIKAALPVRRAEGLGHGDVKMLAMIGAVLGWRSFPAVPLLASLRGAVIGAPLSLRSGRVMLLPLPLGVFHVELEPSVPFGHVAGPHYRPAADVVAVVGRPEHAAADAPLRRHHDREHQRLLDSEQLRRQPGRRPAALCPPRFPARPPSRRTPAAADAPASDAAKSAAPRQGGVRSTPPP